MLLGSHAPEQRAWLPPHACPRMAAQYQARGQGRGRRVLGARGRSPSRPRLQAALARARRGIEPAADRCGSGMGQRRLAAL